MSRDKPAAAPSAAVAAVVLLALALGLLGSGYGLPYGLYPDEGGFAERAWRIASGLRAGKLQLNPGSFLYPSFLYYVLAAWQLLCGRASSFGPESLREGRLLMAAVSAGGVALLAREGGRAFGAKAGLLSGLFLALSAPWLDSARRVNPDGLLAGLTLASAAGLWAFGRSGRSGALAWAGLAAGLAAGTKYLGALLLIPAAAAALMSRRASPARFFALFAGALAAGFILSSPYSLLDAAASLRDLRLQFLNQSSGQTGFVRADWAYYFRSLDPVPNDPALANTLRGGLGLPFLAASAAGLAVLARRRSREGLVAAAFVLPYLLLISASPSKQIRFVLPALPFLCLFAAAAVEAVRSKVLSWALAALLLAGLAVPTAGHLRELTGVDSRVFAGRWLDRSLPAGAEILTPPLYGPLPSARRFVLKRLNLPEYGWQLSTWAPAGVARRGSPERGFVVLSTYYEEPQWREADGGGGFAAYARDLIALFDGLRARSSPVAVLGAGLPGPRLEIRAFRPRG